jgi:sarcosine oxidase subunit beta
MPDVVVIGAGISGSAAAYYLAKDGFDVTLIDRYGPAAMASGWTLAGVRQSGRHPAELPLAKAAVQVWAGLDEALDGATNYRRTGNLRCARTQDEVETIRKLVAEQKAAGLEITFLPNNEDVRAVAPAVSERVLAASLCHSDGSADPVATVWAFVRAAERLGVTVLFGERVRHIDHENGRVSAVVTDTGRIATARVVIAAGIFGNELLEPLGITIPLSVPMVTVLRSEPLPAMLEQVIGVANADCAGRQEVGGRFRVTSGAIAWHGRMVENSANGRSQPHVYPTASSMAEVVRLFGEVIPAFRTAQIEESWAGLLDMTPDALPVIDEVPGVAGVTVAMGFSGHGFCLGPITGQILSRMVQGAPVELVMEPFRIGRFQSRRYAPNATTNEAATLHG